ncbi:MAG: bifunctional phosphopantothenoylcysteine decarboxylase/phosphopantothenate--cysteine ligase CoaBC [Deltaproteobacteria bacterium]|nr:bifunctional phosphopantothenoylcysteine decarboxylase/phosphopantothenate--cysteine ligase CoaBC [Deltaproteobacteria bacterium]MBI4794438.1 bifunctional phosphopantothenoylcysteine decarboxylase/phosphopantothenate--cysteine ligase CoaBC [Deltaproteobacteria bacterium]
MAFTGKRILLGVSGGIAAYKAAELARRLVSGGAAVKVVMTRAAQEFVTPLTFQALTGEEVATTMFGPGSEPLEHVALGQKVDALVLAPATANLLGKMAAGIGDDLLTTILLAATKPILVCPAMNCEMWANPAVQENVARLRDRGLTVLQPEAGELACGAVGYGRLPEPETILEALAKLVTPQDLAGRRILVTAGPTHEDMDPVRFLTNRSSGKQGYALAKVAWRRGAEVCLISGPSHLPAPQGVERLEVRSAREMLDAVLARFPQTEALLMAAAVGDYHPTSRAEHKIKRGSQELTVHLTQNPDILKEVAALKKRQVVVGFAAETRDLEATARRKLEDKGLDLIVANQVNRPDSGFAVDTNEVAIIGRKNLLVRLPLLSKEEVAAKVLDQVVALLPTRQGGKSA